MWINNKVTINSPTKNQKKLEKLTEAWKTLAAEWKSSVFSTSTRSNIHSVNFYIFASSCQSTIIRSMRLQKHMGAIIHYKAPFGSWNKRNRNCILWEMHTRSKCDGIWWYQFLCLDTSGFGIKRRFVFLFKWLHRIKSQIK